MSTHNTEGRREIEAIKQRLSAAKSQVSTATNNVASTKAMATKMIESAQTMSDMAEKEVKEIEYTLKKAKDKAKEMKDALNNVKSMTQSNIDTMQSQLETSKKELNDVEKLLTEAEQRATQEAEGSSNKRRKISPQTISSGITVKMEEDNDYDKETDNEEEPDYNNITVKMEQDSDHHYDDETDKEDDDEEYEIANQTNNSAANSKTNAASSNSNTGSSELNNGMNSATGSTNNQEAAIGQINQVIVEGWANSNCNGTYTKIVGQTHDGAPVYCNSKGKVIYRNSMIMGPNNWFISDWNGSDSSIEGCHYCGSPNYADNMTPPTSGWVDLNPITMGVLVQHPKLRLVAANIEANSGSRQSNDDMNYTATSTTNNNDHAYDDDTDKEDDEEDETTNQTTNNTSDNFNQVVVEGCGLSDVNGTYNRVPGVMYKGAPVYSKKVLHMGTILSDKKAVEYVIYRNSMSFSPNNWFISGWKGSVSDIDSSPNNVSLYGSPQNADCLAPPVNGWKVTYGCQPAPKISTSSAPATDIQPTNSSMGYEAEAIVRKTVGRRNTVPGELKDAEELLVTARDATRTLKTHLGYVDQMPTLMASILDQHIMAQHRSIPKEEFGRINQLPLHSFGIE